MKFKYGWSRYILRIAMENIIPIENQWRPLKTLLDPVYQKNLIRFEKNILENIIFSKNEIINEYVNINTLKIIYQKLLQNDESSDSRYIWNIILLSIWLQKNNY